MTDKTKTCSRCEAVRQADRVAELERERDADRMAVTNCDKLKVARDTRRHWQQRAEQSEAECKRMREVVKLRLPEIAKKLKEQYIKTGRIRQLDEADFRCEFEKALSSPPGASAEEK